MYAVAAVVMGGAAVWVALLGFRPAPTHGTAAVCAHVGHRGSKSRAGRGRASPRSRVRAWAAPWSGASRPDRSACVVGGFGGVLLGRALGRLETPSVARERLRIERDLPVAVDLLSACAVAGLPVMAALPTVARALGGPIAQTVRHAARAVGARCIGPGGVGAPRRRSRAAPARVGDGPGAPVRCPRRRDAGPTRGRRPPRATQPAAGGGAGGRGQGGGADGGLLPARVHAHRRRAHDRRRVPPPRPLTVRPQPAVTRAPVNRLRAATGPTGRAGFG